MKFVITLIKRYKLTLMTLLLILCLTFCKPTNLGRTSTIIGIDKAVHFIMYSTLCAVFWFENFRLPNVPKLRCLLFYAVLLPIVLGGLLEYLQSILTSYRDSEFDDFLFNTAGVLFAALFSLLFTRPLMRRRRKRLAKG